PRPCGFPRPSYTTPSGPRESGRSGRIRARSVVSGLSGRYARLKQPAPSAIRQRVCFMFDPYHRWLGIPRDQRPPTFYQLLGISPDEPDPEVIQGAALRQTSHVRLYQTGPYAARCTAILNEIGQARSVLLHQEKRKQYDAGLTRPVTVELAVTEPLPPPP